VALKGVIMRVQFMPRPANVLRFPVERRVPPSLALLRHIVPEAGEVAALAQSFGLQPAPAVSRLDGSAMIAACLEEHILPDNLKARQRALGLILHPFVATAIQACAHAEWFLARAVAAERRWFAFKHVNEQTAASLAAAAGAAWAAAAQAFVAAYRRSEEAEGAAQQVGLAHSRAVERPFDDKLQARAEKLIFGAGRRPA
jgi:hypothetical protein